MATALTSARGEILIGTDKAKAAIKSLSGDLKGFAGAAGKMGSTGLTALGAGLAAGFVTGISKAADFEHQMSAIESVLTLTGDQAGDLSDKILEIGQSSSFTAMEVGVVAENLGKMGVGFEDMMNGALQAVTDLSAATATSPENAAMIVGQAMTQYQLAGDQAEEVADLFTRTANSTAADVEGLGVSFAYVAGQAHNLGIPMPDLLTSLGILADNGVRGSRAGTSLGRVFTTLLNPTNEAAEAMAKYNIHALDLEGNFVGIPALLDQLNTSFAGMTDSQKSAALAEIFLSNGARALLPLMKSQDQAAKDAGKSWGDYALGVLTGNSASEAAAKRLDNLQGSVEKFKGSLDTILVKLGSLFLAPLKGLVDFATMITTAFGNMSEASFALAAALAAPIAAFGALRLAAILAYNPIIRYIPGFEAFATAAGKAALPVAILVGGMALLGLAYKKNFGGLKDWVDGVKGKVKDVKDLFKILSQPNQNSGILDPVTGETIFNNSKKMDKLTTKARLLGKAIHAVTGIDMRKWLVEMAGAVDRFPKSFKKLKTQLNQIGDVIKKDGLMAGIKNFFGEGGKGVAEAFGDGISAVPKFFGDAIKNIKTGNKTIDKILSETGKSFTDFGRLIQEVGQGDVQGFIDVAERLGNRLLDLAAFTAKVVLNVVFDVVSDLAALTWDWVLDELFGEDDILNSQGEVIGGEHHETLPDVVFEVAARVLAFFKGLFEAGGGAIADLAKWVANKATGKDGTAPTGLFDSNGDQIMANEPGASAADFVSTIVTKAEALFIGIFEAGGGLISNLFSWVHDKATAGATYGPNGSMDPARGYVGPGDAADFVTSITAKAQAFFGGVIDAAGGAISDIYSWAKEQAGAGATFGPNGSMDPARGYQAEGGAADIVIGLLTKFKAFWGGIDWGGFGDAAAWIRSHISEPIPVGPLETSIKWATVDKDTQDEAVGKGQEAGKNFMEKFTEGLTNAFNEGIANIGGLFGKGGSQDPARPDQGGGGNLAVAMENWAVGFVEGAGLVMLGTFKKNWNMMLIDPIKGLGGIINDGLISFFNTTGDNWTAVSDASIGFFNGFGDAIVNGLKANLMGTSDQATGLFDSSGEQIMGGQSGLLSEIKNIWDNSLIMDIVGLFEDAEIPTISLPDIPWDYAAIEQSITDVKNFIDRQVDVLKGYWNKLQFWKDGGDTDANPLSAASMAQNQGLVFGAGVSRPETDPVPKPEALPDDPVRIKAVYDVDDTALETSIKALDKDYDVKATIKVDRAELDGIFGGGNNNSETGPRGGNQIKVKITADAGDFTNTYTSVFMAMDAINTKTATAHFTAEYAGVVNAYIGAVGYGVAWDARRDQSSFLTDYAGVVNSYIAAVDMGNAWENRTDTSTFDADVAPAMIAAAAAFDIGRAWDGQVFTASFSIDTSGITAAVAVAQAAAQTIRDIMPNSPAKKGPLKTPITFDYIADSMNESMDATVAYAKYGVAATADMLRSSGVTAEMANAALANRGDTARSAVVNQYIINTMDPEHYTELIENARFGREFGEAYYEELDLTE